MPSKQQESIIHAPHDSHIKVVAVPGSGKSTTMRHRVSHLINECRVDARRMLTLMFNKSARVEFSSKISQMLGSNKVPTTRTFHSIGQRLCGTLSNAGYLVPADLVEDPTQRLALALARQSLDEVVGRTKIRSISADNRSAQIAFLDFVGYVKSSTNSAQMAFLRAKLDKNFECYIKCFEIFEYHRQNARQRFFSDLIYDPVMALRLNPDAQIFIGNKMDQVLVDEYQDINEISQELVKFIAGDSAFVTVVGDDDQTIYEFLGSNPHYLIRSFEETFHNPIVFTLSRTYRYGHTISLIANNVIRNNTDRFPKSCISDGSTKPAVIKLFQAEYACSSLDEAIDTVAVSIQNYQAKGYSYKDCAVLLRLFSGSPSIEFAFMTKQIPYKLEGARSVLNQEPFLTLISIIQCCAEHKPNDDSTTLHKLTPMLLSFPPLILKKPLREKLSQLLHTRSFHVTDFFEELSPTLNKAARVRLFNRLSAIDWVMKSLDQPPETLISGYLDKSSARSLIRNFGNYEDDGAEMTRSLDTFVSFLKAIKITSNRDLSTFIASFLARCDTSTSVVLITTVHRSKGLEWPIVIIPRLCETYFPHEKRNQETDIQSERRLFYVAITRASKHLVLITPSDDLLERAISNRSSQVPLSIFGDPARASRFVYEANILASVELAKDIHTSQSYSVLEEMENPTVFNQYLASIGSDIIIAPKRTTLIL